MSVHINKQSVPQLLARIVLHSQTVFMVKNPSTPKSDQSQIPPVPHHKYDMPQYEECGFC